MKLATTLCPLLRTPVVRSVLISSSVHAPSPVSGSGVRFGVGNDPNGVVKYTPPARKRSWISCPPFVGLWHVRQFASRTR
jgi:hypothetical protein